MTMAKINLVNHGLYAEHNMPCAVCGRELAVFQCNHGYYKPCWTCQSEGWSTRRSWWGRIRERINFAPGGPFATGCSDSSVYTAPAQTKETP